MPTEIDNVNTCLSIYQDPTDQLNCTRTALGYAPVTATSEKPSSTLDYLILAGVVTVLYILATRK